MLNNSEVKIGKEIFSSEIIQTKIVNYAQKLNQLYDQKELIIIGVLNGAVFFLTNLIQHLELSVKFDFVAASSYIKNHKKETIKFYKELKIDVTNKHVLLLEDIIDTGQTITLIYQHFQTLKPKSLRVCTLIKLFIGNDLPFEFDYLLSLKEKVWVVGFGIDYDEHFRHLKGIHEIKCLKFKKPIKNQ